MVTLALFDTLLGLNHEQLMVDLLLKHLSGAPHVPVAQRHKINQIQSYAKTVDYFIDLAPEVMKNSKKIIAEHNSTDYQQPTSLPHSSNVSKTIGADWNHFSTISSETLYSNYHAYLFDSNQKVKHKRQACNQWSENYFYKVVMKENHSQIPNNFVKQLIKSFLAEFASELHESPSQPMTGKQFDSLQSIGESSGYESLFRLDEDEDISEIGYHKSTESDRSSVISSSRNTRKIAEPWKVSLREEKPAEIDLDTRTQDTVSLGKRL